MTDEVKVNIEYCGNCGHIKQFIELANEIQEVLPEAKISGQPSSRRGSFEIHVNDELVYSKLDTLAFPDFKEVKSVVKNVSEGKPATKVKGQQPILDCRIV